MLSSGGFPLLTALSRKLRGRVSTWHGSVKKTVLADRLELIGFLGEIDPDNSRVRSSTEI